MTPEQIQVERDRLLEGGRSLEEAMRMQAYAGAEAEALLWTRGAVAAREACVRAVVAGLDLPPTAVAQVLGRIDLTRLMPRFARGADLNASAPCDHRNTGRGARTDAQGIKRMVCIECGQEP